MFAVADNPDRRAQKPCSAAPRAKVGHPGEAGQTPEPHSARASPSRRVISLQGEAGCQLAVFTRARSGAPTARAAVKGAHGQGRRLPWARMWAARVGRESLAGTALFPERMPA